MYNVGIRPTDEAKLNELQTKELKNGRLAMLSTAGMAYQTYVTGQGTNLLHTITHSYITNPSQTNTQTCINVNIFISGYNSFSFFNTLKFRTMGTIDIWPYLSFR